MTRHYLYPGLLFGVALTTALGATALGGSAFAGPHDNDVAMAAPSTTDRDADDSSRSMANSKGPSSLDRDEGRDRAHDRMNQQGLEHSQAQARNGDRDADDRYGARDNDARADRHADSDADQDRDRDRDSSDSR